LLRDLPDAPLASNFTSQVMRAVERGGRRRQLPPVLRWFGWHRPAVRAAWTFLIVGAAALGYYAYEAAARAILAASVTTVATSVDRAARAVELPSAEVWQDFDSIARLSQPQPPADLELLAALK
jgi:hypothetical protein